MNDTGLLATLTRRGFVEQVTADNMDDVLSAQPTCVYCGFDPTADSLHLGHLVPVLMLSHFQRAGHRAIALVGGATGMIGDPSGRSDERNLLTAEQVADNANALKEQLSHFIDFSDASKAILVNNHDWVGPMGFIDWLREVGKFFTVNNMMAKESVKQRLASENGISFTEFSYQTLQAYDFLHLFRNEGCRFQVGGNDQWGNITAGMDLIRKRESGQVYGLTCPLITTADGAKFGKSAGNAVWLDPARTSPYDFYQYFIRTQDADVKRFLLLFTFLDEAEIAQIVADHEASPEQRIGQRRLAAEITAMAHGQEVAEAVARCSVALFSGQVAGLDEAAMEQILRQVPVSDVSADALATGLPIIDAAVQAGLCDSRKQAKKSIVAGSVYLNDERASADATVTESDLLHGSTIFLRRGKKNYAALRRL